MDCRVYVVRAFCRDERGGNLAGVVLEQGLTSSQMQTIARELNFSETAFLTKTGPNHYKALYFTPSSVIGFCGHATVAAFGVIEHLSPVKHATYYLDTAVGPCEVTLSESMIFLSQPLPVFGEIVPAEEIAPSLGITISDIHSTKLKAQVVATGLRDIFVPVSTRDVLYSIKPDHEQISRLCEKYETIGLHAFTLESSEKTTTAFGRNFAPLYGIPEESATGSSNGALGCFLHQENLLTSNSKHTLLFNQGDLLNAPSNIYVRLALIGNTIHKVECGGKVVIDEIRILAI